MPNPILKPGDTIALAAPASNAQSREEVLAVEAYIRATYGVAVVFAEDTYQPLPACVRAEKLLEYWRDPTIKMIWALRGGEGSADVVPHLEKEIKTLKANRKFLLGFSDITAMLLFYDQIVGGPCCHGPGALRLIGDSLAPITHQALADYLLRGELPIEAMTLIGLNQAAHKETKLTGLLRGGCLTMLQLSALETWQLDAADRIIILEDVHEKPHAIKRTLNHLHRINLFKGAKAVVFGDFCAQPIGADEAAQKRNEEGVQKVIHAFAAKLPMPVLQCPWLGHGQFNFPLPFNRKMTLELGAQPKFS